MSAVKELLHQIPDPNLPDNERVRLRCQLARQFERTGNYAAACRAMDDLWPGVGKRPSLDSLDAHTSAEVLQRIGVLTGWIGNIKLIKGSQEIAKSLLIESWEIFEAVGDLKKVAETQTEIALCYLREGSIDVARALFADALTRLDDRDGDLKALAVLRSAMAESRASRLNDALDILTTAVSLFEASTNHALKGSFHNELAIVLKRLRARENSEDYIESVLRHFNAASFHYEQAGHSSYRGSLENNLAMFLLEIGRFAEAHHHLDCAQAVLTKLNDSIYLTDVEESRARVLLAEGEIAKAEKIINSVIRILERGDHKALLAQALTTRGVALSRLGRWIEAFASFERAIDIAEQAGDFEKAGLAALALIEELPEHLSENELCLILERARGFLKYTQNTATLRRLTECAWHALSTIHTTRPDWTTFSLTETLRRHEARFIQMALEDCGGSVTKAASLLGLPGHQSLNFILQNRHPELLSARTPIKRRRRSTLKLVEPGGGNGKPDE
ncbi:MAG TPA: tetratricopeptide repeat protein [Pyrinomonadaceae bacterium]|jgi:tetratricopeptide (TPR) repeat protein